VLRKIRDLVSAGAVVAGAKPLSTPSLSDDEVEFRRLADELWGTGTAGGGARTGKGTVSDGSLGDVLKHLAVAPDFEHTQPEADGPGRGGGGEGLHSSDPASPPPSALHRPQRTAPTAWRSRSSTSSSRSAP